MPEIAPERVTPAELSWLIVPFWLNNTPAVELKAVLPVTWSMPPPVPPKVKPPAPRLPVAATEVRLPEWSCRRVAIGIAQDQSSRTALDQAAAAAEDTAHRGRIGRTCVDVHGEVAAAAETDRVLERQGVVGGRCVQHEIAGLEGHRGGHAQDERIGVAIVGHGFDGDADRRSISAEAARAAGDRHAAVEVGPRFEHAAVENQGAGREAVGGATLLP